MLNRFDYYKRRVARMPGAVAGAVAAVVGAGTIGTALIGVALSIGLSLISQALKPKPPGVGRQDRSRDRLVQARDPAAPRRIIVGRHRVSGPIHYIGTTDDDEFLHIVITLGEGPVESIPTVLLNDDAVFDDQIAGNGNVTSGKYAGRVRIKRHLGEENQSADSDLVSEVGEWTNNHRLRGIAYIYVRLQGDVDLFPSQVPNISAVVKGWKWFDPRDDSTKWTPNAVLVQRGYLTNDYFGLAAEQDVEVDEDFAEASANTAEEMVETAETDYDVDAVQTGSDALDMSDEFLRLQDGDRVEVESTGSLPGGLSANTDYYVIVKRHKQGPEGEKARVQLASSLANAWSETAVSITSDGSGDIKLVKTGEPRYTADGAIDFDQDHRDVLQDLLSATEGRITPIGGKWRIRVAAWTAPTLILDESDVRARVSVQTRQSRRDRFNAVHGVSARPENDWQPTNYTPWKNDTFKAQDRDERIWTSIDRPFTTRNSACQRLAKIALLRMRHEISVNLPAKLSAFRLEAGSTVGLTNERWGFDNKPFEVEQSVFVPDAGDDGPGFAMDLSLRETAEEIFDWSKGEETVEPLTPRSNLPAISDIQPPGVPNISEELFVTRDGAGVKALARMEWEPSPTANHLVEGYEVQTKQIEDKDGNAVSEDWEARGTTEQLFFEIRDIKPGIWQFRVRARRRFAGRSDWRMRQKEILGLTENPQQLQSTTIGTAGGLAVIRWDQSPDLDVRVGGHIVFRHAKQQSGAAWQNSVSIADAIPGNATEAVLPLKPGSYLVRARDSGGRLGPVSIVSTKGAQALGFAQIDSLQEDPTFAGTKTDVVATDDILKLRGQDNIDSWPNVDTLSNWDATGGVAPSGTYTFAAGLDLGSVKAARLRSDIEVLVVNTLDKIDERTDPVDEWEEWDGTEAASADAIVEVRYTDDDPNASPDWGDWERLDSSENEFRGAQFRARLKTDDPAYNIQVSELRIEADEVS